jgi:hypothetical protein
MAGALYGSGTLASQLYAGLHALPTGTPMKSALVTQALQLTISTLAGQARALRTVEVRVARADSHRADFLAYRAVRQLLPVLAGESDIAVALVLVALSVSAALFLIIEMVEPFSGLMQISSSAIRAALPPLAP